MKPIFFHFKKLDWVIIFAVVGLALLGLTSLYSSSLHSGDFGNFHKQIFFFTVGILLILIVSFFDWRIFRESSAFVLGFYCIALILLIGVYFLRRLSAA